MKETHRIVKVWERRWEEVWWQGEQVEWVWSVWRKVQPTESTKQKASPRSNLKTAGACHRNHCRCCSAGTERLPLLGPTKEFSHRSDDVEEVTASLSGIIIRWADDLICSCSVYHPIVLVSLDSSQHPFLRALAFGFLEPSVWAMHRFISLWRNS